MKVKLFIVYEDEVTDFPIKMVRQVKDVDDIENKVIEFLKFNGLENRDGSIYDCCGVHKVNVTLGDIMSNLCTCSDPDHHIWVDEHWCLSVVETEVS